MIPFEVILPGVVAVRFGTALGFQMVNAGGLAPTVGEAMKLSSVNSFCRVAGRSIAQKLDAESA